MYFHFLICHFLSGGVGTDVVYTGGDDDDDDLDDEDDEFAGIESPEDLEEKSRLSQAAKQIKQEWPGKKINTLIFF